MNCGDVIVGSVLLGIGVAILLGFAALMSDEVTSVSAAAVEWPALLGGLLAVAAGFLLGSQGRTMRPVVAGRFMMLAGTALAFLWLGLTISQ